MSKLTSFTQTQELSAALADLVAGVAPSVVAIRDGAPKAASC